MPSYQSPGTENLRADHKAMHGKSTDSPSGGGSDVGGTENRGAQTQTKRAAGNTTPGGSGDKRPSGVQNFDSLAGDR